VGVVLLRDGRALWPAVVICIVGVIEGIATSCVLDRWTVDVPTLWHAVQLRRAERRNR
jgi:hypothetical protein